MIYENMIDGKTPEVISPAFFFYMKSSRGWYPPEQAAT